MMKIIFLVAGLFLIMIGGLAQANKKTSFYLHPQAALLNGDHSVSGQVQVSGGVEKKAWSIGIGAAIDYYKIRTVPLYADLRAAFGKDRAIFSYLNVGSNIAWALESQYSNYWVMGRNSKSSFSNGVYTDIGIGYSFRKGKKNSLTMSIGYSMKTTGESHWEAVYRDFPPYTVENHERKTEYTFNRIALRLGIRF
jgi:hypothetical protein